MNNTSFFRFCKLQVKKIPRTNRHVKVDQLDHKVRYFEKGHASHPYSRAPEIINLLICNVIPQGTVRACQNKSEQINAALSQKYPSPLIAGYRQPLLDKSNKGRAWWARHNQNTSHRVRQCRWPNPLLTIKVNAIMKMVVIWQKDRPPLNFSAQNCNQYIDAGIGKKNR